MTANTKKDLFDFAFKRIEKEYSELNDNWKLVETKAQGVIGIAGIFLASAFAFIRNSLMHLSIIEKTLLVALIALLTLSIAFAVLAMLVQRVPAPLTSDQATTMVDDAVKTPEEEHNDRYLGLLADTINAWGPINRNLRDVIRRKADKLAISQKCALGAAATMAVLVITAICGSN